MKRIPKRTIILFAFLSGIILSFILYKIFLIQSIELYGASTLIGLDQFSRKPSFFINTEQASRALMNANPTFENIELNIVYPNTLKITATKSRAVAVLKVSNGYYEISHTGRILVKVRKKETKLPEIVLQQLLPYESYVVGQFINKQEVVFAAYILDKFAQNAIPIETVEMQGFDVVLCKGAGRTYIFSASKDKTVQFSDVAVIYRQFFIEGKKFNKIDVRFDNPIIVFEK